MARRLFVTVCLGLIIRAWCYALKESPPSEADAPLTSFLKRYAGENLRESSFLVGHEGVGPSTSFLSGTRSTVEPMTQKRTT